MKKVTTTLAAGVALALMNGSAFASEAPEIEMNHPLPQAQYVTANGAPMIALEGAVGQINGPTNSDLDFYKFYAQEGDVVTIDIDRGIGGQQSIDTVIAVFDANGNLKRLNDDASVDSGSISSTDSRIDNFLVETTGHYVVGVSNFPRIFRNNGEVYNGMYQASGDYILNISGATEAGPETTIINIDVKPGRDGGDAPYNPRSKGKTPVALLGSQSFDPTSVDISSITFGETGDEDSLHKCNTGGEDVNSDGILDVVCHFDNKKTGFNGNSLEAIVKGVYLDADENEVNFEGRGPLKIVPSKDK